MGGGCVQLEDVVVVLKRLVWAEVSVVREKKRRSMAVSLALLLLLLLLIVFC